MELPERNTIFAFGRSNITVWREVSTPDLYFVGCESEPLTFVLTRKNSLSLLAVYVAYRHVCNDGSYVELSVPKILHSFHSLVLLTSGSAKSTSTLEEPFMR